MDAQKRAEKDAKKKEAKAEAAEQRAEKERKESKVTIKRVERNKRKYVTEISGLEVSGKTSLMRHDVLWTNASNV